MKLAGIRVKAEAAYLTPCVCGAVCGVYTTPENNTWVHCPSCRRQGTSVEYVMAAKQMPPETVAKHLMEIGATQKAADELIAAASHAPTLAFRDLWERAKQNVEPERIGQGAMTILQNERVYTGWNNVPPGVGILFKHDFAVVRNRYPASNLRLRGVQQHKVYIALARYDVPGRVCGITLVHPGGIGNGYSKFGTDIPFTGGIAIDDMSITNRAPVYVFDDPRASLRFQAKAYYALGKHIRVASYTPDTVDSSWDHLRQSQILYLATDSNFVQAVNVCRKLAGAKIIRARAEELDTWIRGTSTAMLPSVHPDMQLDWPKAVQRWLFENPAAMDDRRRQLALSAGDEQRVLEYCTDAERRTLTSGQTIYRETCVDDITVRETDDGYAALLNSKLVAVSNVRLVFTKSIVEQSTSKTWYCGDLVFRGIHIPFMVELSRIQASRDLIPWVSKLTASAGLGVPYIHQAWTTRLLTLATLLSSPVVEHTDRLLGWSDRSQTFYLPTLTISAARGIEPRVLPVNIGMPADVWGLSNDFTTMLGSNQQRAMEYTSFAVMTAASVLSTALGEPPLTFVVGVPTKYGATLSSMAQRLGIPQLEVSSRKGKRLGASAAVHGFPVLYQPEPKDTVDAVSKAVSRPRIVRVGQYMTGFARLLPNTVGLQYPIKGAVSQSSPRRYEDMAARLTCELIYRVLCTPSAEPAVYRVVSALASLATDDNRENIYTLLGELRLPPKTDAAWCEKYLETVAQQVKQQWLPAAVMADGDVTRVYAHRVYKESRARGAAAPHPNLVAEKFCSAGLSSRLLT